MSILTRHLIRAHLGPFLFAVSALTGLLFLNAVSLRMADLAGKGLTWDVIGEFLLLSLPYTIALTLPMSVLVAVLHAFSDMTAANEITAMKASGIAPRRIILPLLVTGTVIGAGMLYFNDRILPEANHRLKNLLLDINRKSPTFTLREQVVNRVQSEETGQLYFISAARIDNRTNHLEEVAIFDGSDPIRGRATYADSGTMAFDRERTDLFLTLFDGVVLEVDAERPGGFQKVYFERQIVPLRGIGNQMDRSSGGTSRGDREMSISMLAENAREREAQMVETRRQNRGQTIEAVQVALGLPLADSVAERWSVARAPSAGRATPAGVASAPDPLTAQAARGATIHLSQITAQGQAADRYRVELHKKYTLAFASIVFVLVGIPLAIRFPRGGLGMVIAASSAIFAVYWVGLIAGEDIADRGIASPGLIMWIPNVVFTVLGLLLVKRMGREAATMRGGGWDDLWWTLKALARRRGGAAEDAT